MAMFYLHRSPFKPLIKKKNNPFINKQSNQIAVLFRSVKRPSHFDFSSQTGSHQQQTSQSGTFFLIAIDWHLLLVKRKTEIWKQQNFTIPYIYVCVCVCFILLALKISIYKSHFSKCNRCVSVHPASKSSGSDCESVLCYASSSWKYNGRLNGSFK